MSMKRRLLKKLSRIANAQISVGEVATLDGATASGAELAVLDGVTGGTVTASKAVVVDANSDIAGFRHVIVTGSVDVNGVADAIIIDADADTTISAPTDDQIDIEIAGADDFTFSANTFTALSGSSIATNTITETTAASGVTIDGVLVKDGRTNAGRQVQTLTATGAITVVSGAVLLNHASVIIAATLAAPTAGDELFIVDSSATGTAAHTVTLPAGVTFDGTNNTATFDLLGETLHILAISATRWLILENIGEVALSNV